MQILFNLFCFSRRLSDDKRRIFQPNRPLFYPQPKLLGAAAVRGRDRSDLLDKADGAHWELIEQLIVREGVGKKHHFLRIARVLAGHPLEGDVGSPESGSL